MLVADRLGGQVQRPGHILGRAHQRRIRGGLNRRTTLDHFQINLKLRVLRSQIAHNTLDLRHRCLDVLVGQRAAIDGRLAPVRDDIGGHPATNGPNIERRRRNQRMRERAQPPGDAVLHRLQDPQHGADCVGALPRRAAVRRPTVCDDAHPHDAFLGDRQAVVGDLADDDVIGVDQPTVDQKLSTVDAAHFFVADGRKHQRTVQRQHLDQGTNRGEHRHQRGLGVGGAPAEHARPHNLSGERVVAP